MSGSTQPSAAGLADSSHAAGQVARSGLTAVPRPSAFQQAMAVLAKDIRGELRNRAAINSILLFAITAMVVVGFAVGAAKPPLEVRAALLWVVLFFAAFSGLAHVFIHEEETQTSMALRLSSQAGPIYVGKLLFNLLLMLVIAVVVVPLFVVMLDLHPDRTGGFVAVVVAGCLGLGGAATIVAAIIAKARGKGALYGALGFPILLPLLFMAVDATRYALIPGSPAQGLNRDIVGLVSFGIMLVTASLLLFPFVWEE